LDVERIFGVRRNVFWALSKIVGLREVGFGEALKVFWLAENVLQVIQKISDVSSLIAI